MKKQSSYYYFRDEFHKWNCILKNEGIGAIQPRKPTDKERNDQQRSKRVGVPKWMGSKRR